MRTLRIVGDDAKRGVGDTFNRLPLNRTDFGVRFATRDTDGWNDARGLVVALIALLAIAAIAIAARSLVLGIVALAIAAVVIPCSTGKVRSRREARRIARR